MSSSMSVLNEDVIRSIVKNTSVPVVLRGKIAKNWPMCEWSLEKWTDIFGRREYPFRCIKKCIHSERPCWERKCSIKKMTFKEFTEAASCSDEAMYFDYKYLHQWFSEDDELCKAIHWEQFGFVNKKPCDTTLWVGSAGAHTPAHQDTYGVNIVVQVYGKKRWILFPPESGGLQPTRVPYEESSVYSDLNFYCPTNVQVFKGLTGGRVTELSAGDALVVPHKWWHYVQNEDPVNISLNMWLPHEDDDSARMSEAVIKTFVTQLCKDLSPEQVKSVVNPTEDDFTDASLQDLLFQLQDTSEECLAKKRKTQHLKRQRTDDVEPSPDSLEYDLGVLLSNSSNKMEIPPIVTGEELIRLLEDNKSRYRKVSMWSQIGEENDENPLLRLIKPVINSFCQANVVDQFKQNLLSHLDTCET